MHKKIDSLFRELEQDTCELIEFLYKQDSTLLNRPPVPGKWSPLQVVYHLIQAETISFKYIEKRHKIAETISYPGFNQSVFSFFVIQALKLPLKFKAPAVVAKVPEKLSLDELKIQWKQIRIEICGVLSLISDTDCKRALYVHPVAGAMNMFDAMRFLLQHFNRHNRQIRNCFK